MSISNFVFHVLLFFNDAKKIMTNNNENEHASELFNRIFSFHHKQQAEMKGWETDNNYAAEQRIISCMIFGSAQTFKTSLLFQAALNHCSDGEKTLFISQTLLNDIPPRINGMCEPNHTNMSYLDITYIDELPALLHFLSSFHLKEIQIIPILIVLDNLDHYIEQIKDDTHVEQQCAKLCALLHDSLHFCSKKRRSVAALLVSCKKTSSCVKLFHLFSHFFQNIWGAYAFKECIHEDKWLVTLTHLGGKNSRTENLTLYKKGNIIFFDNDLVKEKT